MILNLFGYIVAVMKTELSSDFYGNLYYVIVEPLSSCAQMLTDQHD